MDPFNPNDLIKYLDDTSDPEEKVYIESPERQADYEKFKQMCNEMKYVTVIGTLKLDPYIPSVKINTWDINNNEITISLDIETARLLKENLKDFFQDKNNA